MSFLKTKTLALPPAVLVGKDGSIRQTSMFVREHTYSSDPIYVLELLQPHNNNKSMQVNITREEAMRLAASFKELADYMLEQGF